MEKTSSSSMQLASNQMSGSSESDVLKGDAASRRLVSQSRCWPGRIFPALREVQDGDCQLCASSAEILTNNVKRRQLSEQCGLVPEASETRRSESCQKLPLDRRRLGAKCRVPGIDTPTSRVEPEQLQEAPAHDEILEEVEHLVDIIETGVRDETRCHAPNR